MLFFILLVFHFYPEVTFLLVIFMETLTSFPYSQNKAATISSVIVK